MITTSASYSIQTGYVTNKNSIIFSVVCSIVYIGVASNFYYTVGVEELAENCTLTTERNWNLSNFCGNLMTWKVCGLVGLIVPGCLQLVFGSLVIYKIKDLNNDDVEALSESPTRPTWFRLWDAFNYLTTVVNVIIFFFLWTTKVTATQVINTHGLETAAKIYMICVGIELFVIVGSIALAFLCCCCTYACISIRSGCCGNKVLTDLGQQFDDL